jgi:hypothetical protein
MLSVVSEAASEGMRFSAICAPSRFHTAKTHNGLVRAGLGSGASVWAQILGKDIEQERTIPRPYLARSQISLFQQLAHERFYLAVFWCCPRFIDELAGTWAAKVKFCIQVSFGAVIILDSYNQLLMSVRLAENWPQQSSKIQDRVSISLNRTP